MKKEDNHDKTRAEENTCEDTQVEGNMSGGSQEREAGKGAHPDGSWGNQGIWGHAGWGYAPQWGQQ